MTYRRAHVNELDAVVEFGYAVIPHYFAPLLGEDVARTRLSEWTTQHLKSALATDRVHVAVHDGAIVGVCETGELAREPVVWKLYVAPGLRGRGLGAQLLREAIAALPGDADHLLVTHFAGNPVAERFFGAAGFAVIGKEPPMFAEPGSALVWRRLDLREQAAPGQHRESPPGGSFPEELPSR